MRKFCVKIQCALLASSMLCASASAGSDIEVIYSEIAGDPSAVIPGAVDINGDPIVINFKAVEDFNISPDGSMWILRGRADADADIDTFLLIGSGNTGMMLAQEAQPVAGGVAGEVYDFFDGVAGFNNDNDFAYGARARGGDLTVKEKIIRSIGGSVEIIAQESAPINGLMDTGVSGDELCGNSMNSVHLLDDGRVGVVDLSTQNIASSRRPVLLYAGDPPATTGFNINGFLQSGVTLIDVDIWDSFDSNDFSTTPDGAHYLVQGDDEGATATDDILVYDGNVVIREGSEIDMSGITATAVFQSRLAPSGDWISRGDDPNNDDWAVRNGSLIAATGQPITPARGVEAWGDVLLAVDTNSMGDWVVAGNTNSADPASDSVIVLNGDQVVLRENDPIDLDGNGMFDDDVFIGRGNNTFSAFSGSDVRLTDDLVLWVIAPLRDSMGNDLGTFGAGGEALLRIDLGGDNCGPCGDSNCDGVISVSDIAFFVQAVSGGEAGWAGSFPGGVAPCDFLCANDTNGDGLVTVGDIGQFVDTLTNGTPCPVVPGS